MHWKKPQFLLLMTACLSISMPIMMQADSKQNSHEESSGSPLTQAFEKAMKELEEEGIAPARQQPIQVNSEKHIVVEQEAPRGSEVSEKPVSQESSPLTQAFEKAKKELEEEGIAPARGQQSIQASCEKHIVVEQQAVKKAPISKKAVSVESDEPVVISRPDPAARAAEATGQATGRKIGKYLSPRDANPIAEAK